jgi:ABC-type lipoprotein release transport system permease subunit
MNQIIKMAFRDLLRNKRRSIFSSLALGMGLALLLLMAAVISGETGGSMQTSIKLQSGHLQVRAKTYDENKNSLAFEDLIQNPEEVAAKIAALAPVNVATPRLFASGILTEGDESTGLRIYGIDPSSAANEPFKSGMISGEFLKSDDRSGIIIGQTLAEKLNLKSGQTVTLLVNTSNGDVDEQVFTIRGIYTTHTPGFDESTVLMPLAKAQAITKTENHASAIFVLLKNADQIQNVVAALQTSQLKILTYLKMNEVLVQTEDFSRGYMVLIYLIVLAVTASVIVNTLIMSVFERTREIGILSAIGMKSTRIMSLFFIESVFLAVGGILFGLVIGGALVGWFSTYGFFIGNNGVSGMLLGETIYASLQISDAITLTILAFIVALLAALYPAIMAARLEPVDAMRGAK